MSDGREEQENSAIPQLLNRPLTREEFNLAEHLLRFAASPEAAPFIAQLPHARVAGHCPCGCPTVDLTVPPEFCVSNPPAASLIADATGRADGKMVGAMIFQSQGSLSLLEIYRLEDFSDDPFGLPSIETIERIVWNKTDGPVR